ncbi:hypothetical protein LP421_15110 [Rhizobium sp. RCAM05350]|nr:hypothetical protein LP421_15110 [Rhizobium sp. RCAM05350]
METILGNLDPDTDFHETEVTSATSIAEEPASSSAAALLPSQATVPDDVIDEIKQIEEIASESDGFVDPPDQIEANAAEPIADDLPVLEVSAVTDEEVAPILSADTEPTSADAVETPEETDADIVEPTLHAEQAIADTTDIDDHLAGEALIADADHPVPDGSTADGLAETTISETVSDQPDFETPAATFETGVEGTNLLRPILILLRMMMLRPAP